MCPGYHVFESTTERSTCANGQKVRGNSDHCGIISAAKISIGSWLQNDPCILWNTLQRGGEKSAKTTMKTSHRMICMIDLAHVKRTIINVYIYICNIHIYIYILYKNIM